MNQDMTRFQRTVELTQDGSATLYIPEIDEHYHSTNGAIIEAQHVYLKEALEKRVEAQPGVVSFSLLEVGFGTGLNAFLTMLWAQEHQLSLHYTTLELYPLSMELVGLVNYAAQVAPQSQSQYEALHTATWNEPVQITPFFTLEKRQLDLVKDPLEGMFDVVYFDAFAPDKQPEMWQDSIYQKIYDALRPHAVLTTYCAKGVVRRGFQHVGFQMERIPGPPGKREMIRATK